MSQPQKQQRVVNRADLATLCGCSLPTVDAWVRKGCPVVERGSKGREWRFDVSAIINWRIQRAVTDAVASYGGHDQDITKDEADRRRAIALAVIAEVEADTALGLTVGMADAEGANLAFCQVLKTELSNAAAKVAGRATTMTSAPEIQHMCHGEFNRSFASAKAELARRWGIMKAGAKRERGDGVGEHPGPTSAEDERSEQT